MTRDFPRPVRNPRGLAGTLAWLMAASLLAGGAPGARAAVTDYSNVAISLTPTIGGLTNPVLVTNAGDGRNRLFVVEQRGVVKIWKGGTLLSTPFLDLRTKVVSGGERGLLGLAFHPKYETNRKFYVFYTERGTGDLIIAEIRAYSTNPDRANSGSFRQLLRIGHRTYANHNGGMLAFGRDGYLYIATGDGGGSGDPGNHAESRTSRLGKLLRIDVNGTSGSLAYRIPPTNPYATSTVYRREIWSRGLRNPWRFSFDRATGDLWIGDVGQNRWEEIDRATRASGGGWAGNYGWRTMEGFACYSPPSGCSMSGRRRPLAVYGHTLGCAVIGGYVYRGATAILRGAYLFADACSGRIWSVVAAGTSPQTPVEMANTGLPISSFGEDEAGELYAAALNGTVYRVNASLR